MGFWDRFRRGEERPATEPPRAGTGRPGGQLPDGTPDTAPDATDVMSETAPDAASGHDWDGGWRQVPPPAVTVARSAIGVSDGLRFRSRLASWQNPTFGVGLGHAVLPSAPSGLIHGITRPASPGTTSQGGPLLLRTVRTEPDPVADPSVGGGEAGDSGGHGGAAGTRTVQRAGGTTTRTAGPGPTARPGSGTVRPRRDAGSAAEPGPGVLPAAASRGTRPAPIRPHPVGPALTVARRPVMPARRITAIAPAAGAPSAVAQSGRRSTLPQSTVPQVTGATPVRAAPGGVGPSGDHTSADTASPVVPTTASAPATTGSGPAAAVIQRSATDPAGPTGTTEERVRPALGEPLRALPADAVLSDTVLPDAGNRSVTPGFAPTAPAGPMPVLQRQVGPETAAQPEASPSPRPLPQPSARSDAAPPRPRGGLGAPMAALPPTAVSPGNAPLLGDRARMQARIQRSTAGPAHRDPGPVGGPGNGPGNGPVVAPGPVRTSASSPDAAAPSMPVSSPATPHTAASHAAASHAAAQQSAPGPAVVQRAVDGDGPGRRSSAEGHGAGSVAGPGGARERAADTSASPRNPRTATRPAAVPIRPVTSTPGHTTSPSADGGASQALPVVQRARALLADRPLAVSTGAGEDFSAPPTADRTSRVVAATWRRDRPEPTGPPPASPAPSVTRTVAPTVATAAAPGSGPAPAVQRAVRPGATPASRKAASPKAANREAASRGTPVPSAPAVPVVRLAPPASAPAGQDSAGTPVRALSMPVSADPGQPPASAPSLGSGLTGTASRGLPVRTVQRAPSPGAPHTTTPPGGATGSAAQQAARQVAQPLPQQAAQRQAQAQALQRMAKDAGLGGVPMTAVPARTPSAPATPGSAAAETPAANQAAGIDIEELARRLLDPVGRLLRADMRRGRERAGRLYDGRR